MNQQWNQDRDNYFPFSATDLRPALPKGVYMLDIDPHKGWFLSKSQEKFTFPYKVYGIETEFINRVVKTYEHTKGNLGVLLNGVKGTGKTVTAELICNQLNLPVIIINRLFEADVPSFINSVEANVVIFFDEYEKIYDGYDNSVLSVMDGVLNNGYRRVFLLTTNTPHINDNMLSRPSRIRYIKNFKDLKLETIIEIIDDKLKYLPAREELIKFISGLGIVTVDIVKSLVDEINIHEAGPNTFKDIINAKPSDERWNVYDITDPSEKPLSIFSNVKINPKIMDDNAEGNWFIVDNKNIGRINEIVDEDTIVVEVFRNMYDEFWTKKLIKNKLIKKSNKKPVVSLQDYDNEDNVVFVKIKLDKSYSMHSSFSEYAF